MLAEGPDAIGVAEAVRQAMAILRERKQINNQEEKMKSEEKVEQ